jgi:hypothetical protein
MIRMVDDPDKPDIPLCRTTFSGRASSHALREGFDESREKITHAYNPRRPDTRLMTSTISATTSNR